MLNITSISDSDDTSSVMEPSGGRGRYLSLQSSSTDLGLGKGRERKSQVPQSGEEEAAELEEW